MKNIMKLFALMMVVAGMNLSVQAAEPSKAFDPGAYYNGYIKLLNPIELEAKFYTMAIRTAAACEFSAAGTAIASAEGTFFSLQAGIEWAIKEMVNSSNTRQAFETSKGMTSEVFAKIIPSLWGKSSACQIDFMKASIIKSELLRRAIFI